MHMREDEATYSRRFSQWCGNGRVGEMMTPIPACAISFASRCASAAPMRVTLILFPSASSTSDLSTITDAMASALWMWMASGIVPCKGNTSLDIRLGLDDYAYSYLFDATKSMFELSLRLAQQ